MYVNASGLRLGAFLCGKRIYRNGLGMEACVAEKPVRRKALAL